MPNRLLEISGEITPERMKRWSQSKNNTPVVDVTGDGSKAQCCKEQYCIATWNVRSMKVKSLSRVRLFCDLMDSNLPGSSVHEILQQEYWSGLPFPFPGDLPDLGIKPRSPALQTDYLPTESLGKPII